jgi:hypothetical protein
MTDSAKVYSIGNYGDTSKRFYIEGEYNHVGINEFPDNDYSLVIASSNNSSGNSMLSRGDAIFESNVGIGTNNPGYKLEVHGQTVIETTTDLGLSVKSKQDGTGRDCGIEIIGSRGTNKTKDIAYIDLRNNDTAAGGENTLGRISAKVTNTDNNYGKLMFYANTNGTLINIMELQDVSATINGDLDVTGATTLNSTLDVTDNLTVSGTANLNGGLQFPNSNAQKINLYSSSHGIGVQTSTTYFRSSNNFAWFKEGSHSDTTFDAGTNGSTLMVLNSSGNLGIGTTSPSYNLDVTGTANVSSDLTVGGVTNTNVISCTPASHTFNGGGGTNTVTETTGILFTNNRAGNISWDGNDWSFNYGSGGSRKNILVFGYSGFFINNSTNISGTLSVSSDLTVNDGTLNVYNNTDYDSNGVDVLNLYASHNDNNVISPGYGGKINFNVNRSDGNYATSAYIKGYITQTGTADYHAVDIDVYGDNRALHRGITVQSVNGNSNSSTIYGAETIVHGVLGIGTTSPSSTLDVAGTINISSTPLCNITYDFIHKTAQGNSEQWLSHAPIKDGNWNGNLIRLATSPVNFKVYAFTWSIDDDGDSELTLEFTLIKSTDSDKDAAYNTLDTWNFTYVSNNNRRGYIVINSETQFNAGEHIGVRVKTTNSQTLDAEGVFRLWCYQV